MTSKERVRAAIRHEKPDRVPAAYEAVGPVNEKLLKHYGYTNMDQLLERYQVDIVPVGPRYIGPELKTRKNSRGELVVTSFWGHESTLHATGVDTYPVTTHFPLAGMETIDDVKKGYRFPSPDWFDYASLAEQCARYPGKALIFGHEGPFQMVTFLMDMEEFFLLMVDHPETARYILDQMVAFELEFYRRCFEAAGGRLDILRPHDDYGTQISLLFSVEMWREFFSENTRRLVRLAHEYGAFYQQHSCGAVAPIIPELIACGVDVLEPLQKVPGLYPQELKARYEGQLTFHGGIDTQSLLPRGTPEQVQREARAYMELLGAHGGYILMASQGFEGDVPLENIEALYSVSREL